ncbi:MAG: ATP-binding protein [Rhodoferax sp.]|uniref:ATP-binding protein n=1 Tax=Rhodoferax sp. TaxID=50421 RepID=UPI0027157E9B|nr:ATP-binding protein [Rhodoferax sp.]MDO8449121.1 ATP-binding protein [Rhodoferax sp.]
MVSSDPAGAVDAVDPTQPGTAGQRQVSLLEVAKTDITRRERAVIDDEAAVLGRENSATAREDAALSREDAAASREDAAHLREGEATSREGEIRVATALQAASDEQMLMLQQANAQLVIATMDAQKLTARLELAQVQLERAKSVAEKANLAKSDFLSSMSHELRTPLNAILGFAQLMELDSHPPTPTQSANIAQILQAGWYLLSLIDQVLDLAVIESGKLPVSPEAVLLIDVMRECQAMIEPQAQQRDVQVTFLPFDNTWFANADRIRVKQVLLNLLSNAIKYNRERGTIEVHCTEGKPGRIRISVKDSGAGLSVDNLAHLFEPFNRLGQEASAEPGTGIGLVVTKQLVELMGGEIGVESTLGVGTVFWIELNRDVMPDPGADQAIAAEAAQHGQRDGARRTLLCVEDNPSNLMLIAQIVGGHPHIRMLSASDADLGLALARAHRPDVILMDISLPGISGFDALKLLQADPATACIPVLAISANAMPNDIQKGLAAGFLRYITKPIKVSEFMDALNMALRLAETGSP